MKFLQSLADHFELPTLILSIVFVGIGLFLSYLLGIVTTLECSRLGSSQTCHLQNDWMGMVTLNDRVVGKVHAASVEESCDDDGCTYRVAFETDQGRLPLGDAYSSGSASKQASADRVNTFIKDSSIPGVKVQDGGGLWLFIPLIFIAVGVGIIARPLIGLLKPRINPEP